MKAFGYAGKILRIDLSSRKVHLEDTAEYGARFLGGKGIDQWILYNEVRPGIWPFDPANRLIFGPGVLTGTIAPMASRYSVDGKNALTGGVGSANAGGNFGPELKYAGYDNVVIQGRSRRPCFLWVDDDKVEIKAGDHLWGKTTWETDAIIREELRDEDVQVASIGPAGENLVRAACIINNNGRAAGRCGLGAVMGSKNLKAVAVRGSRPILIAKSQEFMNLVEELWEKIKVAQERIGDRACVPADAVGGAAPRNAHSGNQVRNFQDGFWNVDKVRKTDFRALERYEVRKIACFACLTPTTGCAYLRIPNGKFEGTEGQGYYYNTIRNFGVKLDIDNIEAIIRAHILCSQYGLDVDNTAGPIAWAMECYQRGILTEKDTGGLKLEWGDHEVMLELINKIAFREGFGDLLAEGCKRASEIVGRGSEKYCMHIKGQDLYEHLRTTIGWALGVIVSPRGGGHLDGAPSTETWEIDPDLSMKIYGVSTAGDRRAYEGKAELVVFVENLTAVINSLGLCVFCSQYSNPHLLGFEDLARLVSATTGHNTTAAKLVEIGERIVNVEKAFNVREGMTVKDDYPPDRFFEPISSGPGKGESLDRKKYEHMLSEYYVRRGWGAKTSLPTRSKLQELGLKEIANELDDLGVV